MSFAETIKKYLKIAGAAIVKAAKAVAAAWRAGWDFCEEKAVVLQDIYEIRDFKNTSTMGIGFGFLALFFGFFYMSINDVSKRIVLGFQLFGGVDDAFILLAVIFLIAGTLTTTGAGLTFIGFGMFLPLAGTVLQLLVSLIAGSFVEYISAHYLSLIFFAAVAGIYLLTYFRIIKVRPARYILSVVTIALAVLAVLSLVLQTAPFYGAEMAEIKGVEGEVLCAFVYVSDFLRFLSLLVSFLCIHLSIFDNSDGQIAVSTALEVEHREEF